MSYGFHGKNFQKTEFCYQSCNAWVLHSENSVKILFVVVELLSKKSQISVIYWYLEDLPYLAPSVVHFCHTQPVFGSFQSLLNYSRKSITPRKSCSEHELYRCQNVNLFSLKQTYYQTTAYESTKPSEI